MLASAFLFSTLFSSFHVNPVILTISRDAPSMQVVIDNEGDEPARFQVTTFTWDQTDTEELKLTPTDAIIVFPTLFTVEAHGKRTLRVGMKQPPSGPEETYRVVLEQLGDTKKSEPAKTMGVQMLTRMTLPLFTAVEKGKPIAALTDVALQKGLLSWRLMNTGTVHLAPKSVRVVLRDAAGATLTQDERKAWYVLRGRAHRHEVALPPDACKKTKTIELTLVGDDATASATLPVTPQQCSGS